MGSTHSLSWAYRLNIRENIKFVYFHVMSDIIVTFNVFVIIFCVCRFSYFNLFLTDHLIIYSQPLQRCYLNVPRQVFSGSRNLIEPELYINSYWMISYKVSIFCVDCKSKINPTAGRVLHRWNPWGKIFLNYSSLNPLEPF